MQLESTRYVSRSKDLRKPEAVARGNCFWIVIGNHRRGVVNQAIEDTVRLSRGALQMEQITRSQRVQVRRQFWHAFQHEGMAAIIGVRITTKPFIDQHGEAQAVGEGACETERVIRLRTPVNPHPVKHIPRVGPDASAKRLEYTFLHAYGTPASGARVQ